MEANMDAKTARVKIWEDLLKVAKPDSKFSWAFSEFNCDYEGSEQGTALMTESGKVGYVGRGNIKSGELVITPDYSEN